MGKQSGEGVSVHPSNMDTLDPTLAHRFFTQRLFDRDNDEYILSALCPDAKKIIPRRIPPEALEG